MLMERFLETLVSWVLGILGVFSVALLISLPFLWWADYKRPTFTLKKDDWVCTQMKTVHYTQMIMAGKVMVPMVQTREECIQWTAK
jgi:hypothetical protein